MIVFIKIVKILMEIFYEKVFANSSPPGDENNNLNGDLKLSYDRHIQVSTETASEICLKTTSQSTSASWKRHREILITSSRAIASGEAENQRHDTVISHPLQVVTYQH